MLAGIATTTMATGMAATVTTESEVGRLGDLPLFLWLSPAFPVGGFAYSHGLEWAFEAGDVINAATVRAWLEDLLASGGLRNDVILFVEAHRASLESDFERLFEANDLAVALAAPLERRLETTAQGDAFVRAAGAAWPCAALDELAARAPEPVAYPIAVGAAAGGHEIALEKSLAAFALSQLSNLVSASVRLGVLGQSEGQGLLAGLAPQAAHLATDAAASSLDDLGGCAFRSDIAAMRHETQYSRLFRS
jgi:urease accessory protein